MTFAYQKPSLVRQTRSHDFADTVACMARARTGQVADPNLTTPRAAPVGLWPFFFLASVLVGTHLI